MSARLSLAPDDLHLVAPLSAGWFTFFQILLLVLLDEAVAMCAAALAFLPTTQQDCFVRAAVVAAFVCRTLCAPVHVLGCA